jgi:hypothetical protein
MLSASSSPARIDDALESLRWWLLDNHYSQHTAEAICAYTVAHSTPVGSCYLEAEDAVGAAACYIAALPGPDPSDGSDWLPGEFPAFTPGPDDLADYGRWAEELEARRRTAAYLDGFNDQRQDWSEVPA